MKIDRDIGLPSIRSTRRSKYPWASMKPGDSFFVPHGRINNLCKLAARRAKIDGRLYTSRQVEGGVRVWRVDGTDYYKPLETAHV